MSRSVTGSPYSEQSVSTKRRARIVSRADTLVLYRPSSKRHRFINVRVNVEAGFIHIQSIHRKMALFKFSIDVVHDLKTVWVNDLLDDERGEIRNCFAVITPESEHILQSVNHRTKIEWMQTISVAVSQSLKFRGSYRPSNWSKLDDLRKWLSVREVEYQYRTHPLYKGATYTGKWNLGMPHICGSMKWLNGDHYEGEFEFGKYYGTGTMTWLSHPTRRSYTGSWQDGLMQGHGEMIYTDESVYTGWWHMGGRCGHGRLDYPDGRGMYIGSWLGDKRNGYGVLDNTTKCERYLGMWRGDRQHGPGLLVATNKFFFSGSYENGDRKLFGQRGSEFVNQDDKWKPLFQSCSAQLEQMVSVIHSPVTTPTTPAKLDASGSDSDSAVALDYSDIGASPEMDTSCRTCNGSLRDNQECVVCRVEGFKSTDHPLGLLVNIITRCFKESYSGIGCHDSLLSHAVGELCSITTRIHHIVKQHCPSLITIDEDDLMGKPMSQLSLMLRSRKRFQRTSQKIPQGTDPTWLHPILLPSIFQTLFALYNEHNWEEDKRLNERVVSLSSVSDQELCQQLGIQSVYECYMQSGRGMDPLSPLGLTQHCDSAVQILQRISQFSTPQNKLLCAQEANDELLKLLDDLKWRSSHQSAHNDSMEIVLESHDSALLSHDHAFGPSRGSQAKRKSIPTGLFSLIIVRAGLENMCSEVQFIQDFAGPNLLAGKDGFLVGKLQDCHFQLLEIQDLVSDNSTNRERLITYVR